MKDLNVAVIKGGWSHAPPAIVTYKEIAQAVKENGWNVSIHDVTNENFVKILLKAKPDVAFITNQGAYGEDGKIQGLMEVLGIRYTGSGVCASAVGMNKFICKQVFKSLGIKTPKGRLLTQSDFFHYERIVDEFNSPFIIKPIMTGSSFGVHLISTQEDFVRLGSDNLNKYGECLIEEFIDGNQIEYSTGILEDDKDIYELPVCQSILLNDKLYSYECKFTPSRNKKIIDPCIPEELKREMVSIAKRVHLEIGCSGLSRTDMILDKKGDIYTFEFNTIPGLLPISIFPQICKFQGFEYAEMVRKIILNAFNDKRMEISKI